MDDKILNKSYERNGKSVLRSYAIPSRIVSSFDWCMDLFENVGEVSYIHSKIQYVIAIIMTISLVWFDSTLMVILYQLSPMLCFWILLPFSLFIGIFCAQCVYRISMEKSIVILSINPANEPIIVKLKYKHLWFGNDVYMCDDPELINCLNVYVEACNYSIFCKELNMISNLVHSLRGNEK